MTVELIRERDAMGCSDVVHCFGYWMIRGSKFIRQ